MDEMISRSAAIESIRECAEAAHNNHEWDMEQGYLNAIECIEEEPSEQPEQSWIPCNERLPENGGRYLISVLDGINRRTTVAPYLPRCKAWTMTGRMAYWKVIAWMPLPEPYKEEKHE